MMQQSTLAETVAKAVREVSGVAFLRPGVGGRLRSVWPASLPDGLPPAGVRINRSSRSQVWTIDVQIVARADARVLDVTRATRAAIASCLDDLHPAQKAAQVTITVTGIV